MKGGGGAGVIPPFVGQVSGHGGIYEGGRGVRAETGKPSPSPLMVYTCASQRINAQSRKTYLEGNIGWGVGCLLLPQLLPLPGRILPTK